LDLGLHRRLLALVSELVNLDDLVSGIHDVSGGGLGVSIAECAVRSSVGCTLSIDGGHAGLFTEAPSRVIVCTAHPDRVVAKALDAGLAATLLGEVGGDRIVVDGLVEMDVTTATRAWRSALPNALGEPVPA
jgi:phosphoribosylformylglycinamidine synthase